MKQLRLRLRLLTRTVTGEGELTLLFQEDRDEEYVDALVFALSHSLAVDKGETTTWNPTAVPPETPDA